MNLSSLVAASVPIPVTALHIIPVYSAQARFLGVYTSAFCFLLLGFAFYSRHSIAKWALGTKGHPTKHSTILLALPGALIVAGLSLVISYHSVLQFSIQDLRSLGVHASTAQILENTDYTEIPRFTLLCACYLGMFLSMEAAFILMALREYLQDILGLSEIDLIDGRRSQHVTSAQAPPTL
jgi:hypothetical protein